MAEYNEGNLRESLSLWDGYPHDDASFFERRLRRIDRALSGGSDYGPLSAHSRFGKSLGLGFLCRFGYHIMASQTVENASLDASQRVVFLGQAAEFQEFSTLEQYVTPSLEYYGETLLQLMATSRADLLAATEEIALSVLRSGRYAPPEGTTGYFTQPSKIGVFALEMLAQARGETIDWESFHVPPDRFWLDVARIGLNEPDPAKAAEWAQELCEAHMRTLATDVENGTMGSSTGHEIRREAHFLWPITTVAFLRMRAGLGHRTDPVDHPLMRTSFQVLHDWQVPAGSWPGAPWWAEVLNKTQTIAPGLAPQIGLIR
ncbi:hypothetical protein BC777_3904 [Yoonia maricola]|uniref:Uncharacterized protein n=1 Tax=Yoonia maricola TaxID=420999 RepID=A0A2M8VZW7_9RHOB|nr:hypothetical protein [Yoonia maricola]PJI84222.1 hypothetical protein BC777_3904 [Yoonia maricola]